jgi:hypothetical protein
MCDSGQETSLHFTLSAIRRAALPQPMEQFLRNHYTDLSNAIANDERWDPEKLCSPLQHLIPKTVAKLDGIPSEQALPMSIIIPDLDGSYKSDVSAVLDDDEGCKCGTAACWAFTPSADLYQYASPYQETSSQPKRDSSPRASSRRSRWHWDDGSLLTPGTS